MTPASAQFETRRLVRLPGGRLAANSHREAARLAAGAGWFLGPWASRICRAGRTGDRPRVHRLERRWGAAVSDYLGVEWDMSGLKHIVPNRRTILLPLHEGFVDALAVLQLGIDVKFVGRDELSEWPTLGRYLRDTSQVLIDPAAGPTSYRYLLESGRAILDQGEALVVFPQGSILGIEVAFSPGAFRLAESLDAWIVPVVITGSHRVWEYPFSPLVRFDQPVSVRVLPPVPPNEAVAAAPSLEAEMKRAALEEVLAPARRFRPETDGYWGGYPYEIDPTFRDLAAQVAAHRNLVSQ